MTWIAAAALAFAAFAFAMLAPAPPRWTTAASGAAAEASPPSPTITTTTSTTSPGRAYSASARAAGLVPCPSALVVLLAAISQHEVALGLLLIVAFSLGLAGALTALGLAVVYTRTLVPPRLAAGRLAAALPGVV